MDEVKQKRNIGRIPILPISYEKADTSVKGELIVDWENRTVYGKTPEEGNIVHLDNDFSEEEKQSMVEVDFTSPHPPFTHRWDVDTHSIQYVHRIAQLRDFNIANPYDIPYKDETGTLAWKNRYDITASSMMRIAREVNKGNNNFIILLEGTINRTANVSGKAYIKLPGNTFTPYCRIIWNLITNDNVDFEIPDFGITWINAKEPFTPNSNKIYTFETWDNGTTWYGSYVNYTKSTVGNWEEVYDDYYTKPEVDDLISWRYHNESNLRGPYKMIGVKTQSEFNSLTKDDNTFYFIENSNELYRGNISLTKGFAIVDNFDNISTILMNKIYFNPSTMECRIFNGSTWINLVRPLNKDLTKVGGDEGVVCKSALIDYLKSITVTSISGTTTYTDEKLPSVESVKSLVGTDIEDTIDKLQFMDGVSYDSTTGKFTFTSNVDADKTIQLSQYVTSITTDTLTNKLTLKYIDNTTKSVSLPPRLVSGYYDEEFTTLYLVLNDTTEIQVDLSNLTAGGGGGAGGTGIASSDSIKMIISPSTSTTSPNIRLSDKNYNAATIISDSTVGLGLYVPESIPSFKKVLSGNKFVYTNEDGSLSETQYEVKAYKDPTINDDNTLYNVKSIKNYVTDMTQLSQKEGNVLKFLYGESNPLDNGFFITLDASSLDTLGIIRKKTENAVTENGITLFTNDGDIHNSGMLISKNSSALYSDTDIPTGNNVRTFIESGIPLTAFIYNTIDEEEGDGYVATTEKNTTMIRVPYTYDEVKLTTLSTNIIPNIVISTILENHNGNVTESKNIWKINDDGSRVSAGSSIVAGSVYEVQHTITLASGYVFGDVSTVLSRGYKLTSSNTLSFNKFFIV